LLAAGVLVVQLLAIIVIALWQFQSIARTVKKHTALSIAPAEYNDSYRTYHTGAIWKKDHHKKWWIGICNGCENPSLVLNGSEIIYSHPLPSIVFGATPSSLEHPKTLV
jgi:hypothetical protein